MRYSELRATISSIAFWFILGISSCFGEPMTFRWIAPCDGVGRICTERIIGKGDIEWDSATELERFLSVTVSKQLGRMPLRGMEICFDSAGGDLQGALRLGQVIHSLDMDTCSESQYDDPAGSKRTALTRVTQPPAPAMCGSAC